MRNNRRSSAFSALLLLTGILAPALASAGEAQPEATQTSPPFEIHRTTTGVRFGTWGTAPSRPAPTLFVLSGTIEETLGDPYFRQSGEFLGRKGYLCVSIDLPCHGLEQLADEPNGLAGWRYRSERGEDLAAESNQRLTRALNHLIETGQTDAGRIAVCGTSRGGFLALHFAATDDRVKCAAAYAPVTDLEVLREFQGLEEDPHVRSLALTQVADKLAGRPVWMIIGDQDRRVGTDNTIALARRITAASLTLKVPSRVELHVLPEPRGHTTPIGAARQAAEWIDRELREIGKR